MYQTIVVGTDGSETANVAVTQALDLAKLCSATVHVVNAFHPVTTAHMANAASVGAPTFDVTAVNSSIEHEASLICEHAATLAEQAGVKCVAHTVAGDPADALVDVAATIGADLIVIGNRGMSGVKRFVLGSVPNKVSHHAQCSVLIVDTKEH